jgi:hypothetical protein
MKKLGNQELFETNVKPSLIILLTTIDYVNK